MPELPTVDLERHILYVAFMNKYYDRGEATQKLIARLMTDYPHVFPTSRKIAYALSYLKSAGYIVEVTDVDRKALQKCIEEESQKHPRRTRERIEKECMKRVGFTSYPMITEPGVVIYCESLRNIEYENKRIKEICKQYQPAENIKEKPNQSTENKNTNCNNNNTRERKK